MSISAVFDTPRGLAPLHHLCARPAPDLTESRAQSRQAAAFVRDAVTTSCSALCCMACHNSRYLGAESSKTLVKRHSKVHMRSMRCNGCKSDSSVVEM
eukprot:6490912-Amphidinium_carterae.2